LPKFNFLNLISPGSESQNTTIFTPKDLTFGKDKKHHNKIFQRSFQVLVSFLSVNSSPLNCFLKKFGKKIWSHDDWFIKCLLAGPYFDIQRKSLYWFKKKSEKFYGTFFCQNFIDPF